MFWSKNIGHGFRIGGRIGGNKGGKSGGDNNNGKGTKKGCLIVFLIFLALYLMNGGLKACTEKNKIPENDTIKEAKREITENIIPEQETPELSVSYNYGDKGIFLTHTQDYFVDPGEKVFVEVKIRDQSIDPESLTVSCDQIESFEINSEKIDSGVMFELVPIETGDYTLWVETLDKTNRTDNFFIVAGDLNNIYREPADPVTPDTHIIRNHEPNTESYIVNTNTKTIHTQNCWHVDKIEFENKSSTTDPYALIEQGYTWCGTCCGGK